MTSSFTVILHVTEPDSDWFWAEMYRDAPLGKDSVSPDLPLFDLIGISTSDCSVPVEVLYVTAAV